MPEGPLSEQVADGARNGVEVVWAQPLVDGEGQHLPAGELGLRGVAAPNSWMATVTLVVMERPGVIDGGFDPPCRECLGQLVAGQTSLIGDPNCELVVDVVSPILLMRHRDRRNAG